MIDMANLNQTVKSHYFIAYDIYLNIYHFTIQLIANAPAYAFTRTINWKLEFGMKERAAGTPKWAPGSKCSRVQGRRVKQRHAGRQGGVGVTERRRSMTKAVVARAGREWIRQRGRRWGCGPAEWTGRRMAACGGWQHVGNFGSLLASSVHIASKWSNSWKRHLKTIFKSGYFHHSHLQMIFRCGC
jgi:hypothetical protein